MRLILKVKMAGWGHAGMYTRSFLFLATNSPKTCKDNTEQSAGLFEPTANTAVFFEELSAINYSVPCLP